MITDKNIILFGPPGIGKSTVIGILKTKGIGAIDLEDLYPNRMRFQIPNLVQGKVLGAADLNPKRKYSNAYKVLLIADQDTYDARRNERDRWLPGKGAQRKHQVADWLTDDFDWVLDTTKLDPQRTAGLLISHFSAKKGGHES